MVGVLLVGAVDGLINLISKKIEFHLFNLFVKHSFCLVTLSPRFKSFGSSLNYLNPTLRPNLRPNSNDSLSHVIDSCKILGSTKGVRPNENKTDLDWF